ncbi:hypothetical protein PI124_g11796 [Phytophthora idaei]|nr:hypothetical protein PI125_g11316 [Phytophthora idaei]KAG3152453.1 hypothetical protein PI126_g10513 [Phytophthora idaei]KAG3243389.1 hypothetical protein PI124_g11796 [Phytophthora idaei]
MMSAHKYRVSWNTASFQPFLARDGVVHARRSRRVVARNEDGGRRGHAKEHWRRWNAQDHGLVQFSHFQI